MKITRAESHAAWQQAQRLLNELHDLTGCCILLMMEVEHDDGSFCHHTFTRGSPYTAETMARIFIDEEKNRGLTRAISSMIPPPPDEGEDWKTQPPA